MPQKVWGKQGNSEVDYQENSETERVFDRVIGVERNRVFISLNIYSQRVIRFRCVQCPDMKKDQPKYNKRQQIMQ